MQRARWTLLACLLGLNMVWAAGTEESAAPPAAAVKAVAGLSIEDLLNVNVTSASQKDQKLSDVAAALTVISAEDIRRSGATTIPDLLRYVPGVQVGAANNSGTSVTIRGFGGIYATKLLVLIDGRSIYNPVNGGVDWQYQRIMMEDIDRVEVIRGPGATVWGANAVNGVINIITKDSKETLGGMVGGIYGTKEQGTGLFRYGFTPAENLTMRVYGEYQNDAANDPIPSSARKFDAAQDAFGGFRTDYRPNDDNHFRLSGDISSTTTGDVQFAGSGLPNGPYFNRIGDEKNLNFIYEHQVAIDNRVTVQAYYDRVARSSDPSSQGICGIIGTTDVQIRHSLPIELLPIKQDLTYGVEYREVGSNLQDTRSLSWKRNRADQTASCFVQDDFHLIDRILTLTVGAKYDHNDYTGSEVQPSVRLLWKVDERNSLWWSYSRAVREPEIINYDATGPRADAPNLKSENMTAYEMGYRVQPAEWLSVDIAGFYNTYDHLIEFYFPPGSLVTTFAQYQKAQVFGVEPSFKAQVQPWWRVTGSYSLSDMHLDNSGIPGGYTYVGASLDGVDPTHQFSIRSSFDLPHNIDIDAGVRYVEQIAGANGYCVGDVRVGWRPTAKWEFSIVGQNLLANDHIENPDQFGNATYVGPSVYGKVLFKF